MEGKAREARLHARLPHAARHGRDIIGEYERYTLYAGLLLGAAFGLMIGFGL